MATADSRRVRTADRAPPGAYRAPVHVVGQIGPKRKLRPDGSLLCEDVPIARTGPMMYQPGDVPIRPPTRPGAAQVLYVTRDRATLFAPESLGSAIGAAITRDHPPTDVTTENWKQLSAGFVLDAWQGEGDEADLMFADLVITDKGLIHAVTTDALREVSLGYTADYEQTGDGEGRQRNIVINHLALVERGRCGPRCAIGDRDSTHEGDPMPRTTDGQPSAGSRPRNRLDGVREALDILEEQEQEDGVHVHVHMPSAATHDAAPEDDLDRPRARTGDALDERLSNVEEGMVEIRGLLTAIAGRLEAPEGPGAGDPPPAGGRAATGDSAALQASFQAMIAQAEILVPGFRAPTFDSALPRAKTVDGMCATRRQVLTHLGATADGATLLGLVSSEGFDVAAAGCDVVATVFKAAASLKGGANNRAATGDRMSVPGAAQPVVSGGGVRQLSADQINKQNAEFWARQEGRA